LLLISNFSAFLGGNRVAELEEVPVKDKLPSPAAAHFGSRSSLIEDSNPILLWKGEAVSRPEVLDFGR
jgi:hypothetical protein